MCTVKLNKNNVMISHAVLVSVLKSMAQVNAVVALGTQALAVKLILPCA